MTDAVIWTGDPKAMVAPVPLGLPGGSEESLDIFERMRDCRRLKKKRVVMTLVKEYSREIVAALRWS